MLNIPVYDRQISSAPLDVDACPMLCYSISHGQFGHLLKPTLFFHKEFVFIETCSLFTCKIEKFFVPLQIFTVVLNAAMLPTTRSASSCVNATRLNKSFQPSNACHLSVWPRALLNTMRHESSRRQRVLSSLTPSVGVMPAHQRQTSCIVFIIKCIISSQKTSVFLHGFITYCIFRRIQDVTQSPILRLQTKHCRFGAQKSPLNLL